MTTPAEKFRGIDTPRVGEPEAGDGVVERPDPIPLAEQFLDSQYRDPAGRATLFRWRGDFHEWRGSAYRPVTDEALDARIYQLVEDLWTFVRDRAGAVVKDDAGHPKLTKIRPRANHVREVRLALPSREILLADRREAPFWLDERQEPAPHEVVALSNGLLDLASGRLHEHSPVFFNQHACDFAYNPNAPEPTRWLDFLNKLWPSDPDSIVTLQDLFGYYMTPDTSQQKIAMIVGPKRSGKGTMGRVLGHLVGRENVAAPALASLGMNFGLQPLLGKSLAIVSDARLSGRSDLVVERLLSISGEDLVTVDRKHRDPLSVTLPTRLVFLTNELPRLLDSSGALASRFIVLILTRSWYGREDPQLTDKLLEELPGIFNWSIEGWRRLASRGRFVVPEASTQAIEDLFDLSSPVSAFLRDCSCVVESGAAADVDALWRRWTSWCEDNGRKPGTKQVLGRDLRAAVPGLRTRQVRGGDSRHREYVGLGLADEYAGRPQ